VDGGTLPRQATGPSTTKKKDQPNPSKKKKKGSRERVQSSVKHEVTTLCGASIQENGKTTTTPEQIKTRQGQGQG
jgi:hypothetical protein